MFKINYLVFIIILGISGIIQFSSCDSSARSKETKNDSIVELKSDTILISKDFLLGKFLPAKDTNFVQVDPNYASVKGFYLNKEAYQAFKKMNEAAKTDGISLKIVSATRTFEQQKKIWEGKFTGSVLYYGKNLATTYPEITERARYILKYSSMPGTSRHHWGTDIDINSVQNNYFQTANGIKTYDWLTENASKYGFCQPYTKIDSLRPHGYSEEKWHWSYMPLSSLYLASYNKYISINDLTGFKGSETAAKLDIINKYVNSTNPACK